MRMMFTPQDNDKCRKRQVFNSKKRKSLKSMNMPIQNLVNTVPTHSKSTIFTECSTRLVPSTVQDRLKCGGWRTLKRTTRAEAKKCWDDIQIASKRSLPPSCEQKYNTNEKVSSTNGSVTDNIEFRTPNKIIIRSDVWHAFTVIFSFLITFIYDQQRQTSLAIKEASKQSWKNFTHNQHQPLQ